MEEKKIKWKIYPVTYCKSNFILFYCCTYNKYIWFGMVKKIVEAEAIDCLVVHSTPKIH